MPDELILKEPLSSKKALATLEWVARYRQDRGKRGYIERFFAVLKNYYRLNDLQRMGLWAAYRHALGISHNHAKR